MMKKSFQVLFAAPSFRHEKRFVRPGIGSSLFPFGGQIFSSQIVNQYVGPRVETTIPFFPLPVCQPASFFSYKSSAVLGTSGSSEQGINMDDSDEKESLQRFAFGYAQIVQADRQQVPLRELALLANELPTSNSQKQTMQESEQSEKNRCEEELLHRSDNEYDISNLRRKLEGNNGSNGNGHIVHRDNDFNVFGYTKLEVVEVETYQGQQAAHATTHTHDTSSFPSSDQDQKEDEMLEEHMRRDSDRLLDTEEIFIPRRRGREKQQSKEQMMGTANDDYKNNLNRNKEDEGKQKGSMKNYLSINWDQRSNQQHGTPSLFPNQSQHQSQNRNYYDRFTKRRKNRWIIPQGPLFAMRQPNHLKLDIHYQDTLVGLHPMNSMSSNEVPQGARSSSTKGKKGHGKNKVKESRTNRIEIPADNSKDEICQQLLQNSHLVSGYGGGYSESIPELEAAYCVDAYAEARYNHMKLKKNQKRLKVAGFNFNIPPFSPQAPQSPRSLSTHIPVPNVTSTILFQAHADLHGSEINKGILKVNKSDIKKRGEKRGKGQARQGEGQRRGRGKKKVKEFHGEEKPDDTICQQLLQNSHLVSGYGGGYSESIPELEAAYCVDANAEERYNHMKLQHNQKRLKGAGFDYNIPPFEEYKKKEMEQQVNRKGNPKQSSVSAPVSNPQKPLTNFNIKTTYDWSKIHEMKMEKKDT